MIEVPDQRSLGLDHRIPAALTWRARGSTRRAGESCEDGIKQGQHIFGPSIDLRIVCKDVADNAPVEKVGGRVEGCRGRGERARGIVPEIDLVVFGRFDQRVEADPKERATVAVAVEQASSVEVPPVVEDHAGRAGHDGRATGV